MSYFSFTNMLTQAIAIEFISQKRNAEKHFYIEVHIFTTYQSKGVDKRLSCRTSFPPFSVGILSLPKNTYKSDCNHLKVQF